MTKRILFVTGTRADFGKLKPLMREVSGADGFECHVFVTGMHMMSKYGMTVNEIYKSGFKNIFTYMNQREGDTMDMVLANTIIGLGRYLDENRFDMIVVHGDRVEALGGATAGALRNILVAHVEGGEVSGTIDELMRHAITKMSHVHFVASETARKRIVQLGELPGSVFNIGSPDIDVMLSGELPTKEDALERYSIEFQDYGIAIFHPVTTDLKNLYRDAEVFVESLLRSGRNYIVIFPNNDHGSDMIFLAYQRLEGNPNFKLFPSIRFEYFLSLLKHCLFIVGNSSAGVHEAPVYGVPTINIGTRQNGRLKCSSIFDVSFDVDEVVRAIDAACSVVRYAPLDHYGVGRSAELFIGALKSGVMDVDCQKQFQDVNFHV